MNLENLGVQEMNAQELNTFDGGSWWSGSLGHLAYWTQNGLDMTMSFIEGFQAGRDAVIDAHNNVYH